MPPEQTGPASGLFTILFTDLVGSTELLSRAGDEDAQRIAAVIQKIGKVADK